MASEKRKAPGDGRPSKKAKANPEDKPPRRPESKSTSSKSTDRRPVANSVLLQEEKSFPRGGASVLTPFETKQIRAQAERDVLFEQETGKAAKGLDDTDGPVAEDRKAGRPAKKRKRAEEGSKKETEEDTGPKILSLSFKVLVPGSLVLGRITAITSKYLALAMPDNLTGYVSITAISTKLNERIQTLLDSGDEDSEEDDDVSLEKLFHVGQWLRAVVTTPEEDVRANKRHIELTIDPVIVNAQLHAASVTNNCVLQGAVRSVEDHGVILDLGLKDKNVRGFIAKKELGQLYDVNSLQEGQVMLCIVTGQGSDGKVMKLSSDLSKFWAPSTGKQDPTLSNFQDVETLLPGALIELLITDASSRGVTGKLGGLVDVTIDALHAGVGTSQDFDVSKTYKIGSKTRARIVFSVLNDDASRRIGASVLSHVLALPPPVSRLPPSITAKVRTAAADLESSIAASTIIEKAQVKSVLSQRGVHMELLGADEKPVGRAFAHIAQLSDSHVDDVFATSGPYKVDSVHRARVLNFNPVDGIYYVSLQDSVLNRAFLKLEDVKPGQVVDATVDKLLFGGTSGLVGVLIKLTSTITILVPAIHMSDTSVKAPEKKFREGAKVQAKILSIDLEKRQALGTLKKTLVKDTTPVWTSYNDIVVGAEAKGTIFKLYEKSALVQFFGGIKALLPISEMDEAFVSDPSARFTLGQTVNTRVLTVEPDAQRLTVSCKVYVEMDEVTERAWNAIQHGQIIVGRVSLVAMDSVQIEVEGGLAGSIAVGQLADSASKAQSRLKQLKVGQTLNELVVLAKHERNHQLILSSKSKLVADAKNDRLVTAFTDIVKGHKVHGYVQNIMPEGVYVHFADNVFGLLPKHLLLPEHRQQVDFGMQKDQTVTVWVAQVDKLKERCLLSMSELEEEPSIDTKQEKKKKKHEKTKTTEAEHDVFKIGSLVEGRVTTTRAAQVQVELLEGIHGRIDVSEVFDKFNDITDPKDPLQGRFKNGESVTVRVLGVRDSKAGKFLAFTRRDVTKVLELSVKPSRVKSNSLKLLEGLGEIAVGTEHVVFVNNFADDHVWVSLSPSVRGRIAIADLSDDITRLERPKESFPIGSALKARVIKVDTEAGHLDLSVRGEESLTTTAESLQIGQVIRGRVTKSGESFVTVQLGKDLAGSVQLVELADDFETANPARFKKNAVVGIRVLGVDLPNKRISLSMRPSLVLSSSLQVKDPYLADISSIQKNMIVRGFVKHIGDSGIQISLSGTMDAFVRVSDLTDKYVKDWKSYLQIHQLVRGRVVEVDTLLKRVRLSLRDSALDKDYKPPMKIEDLKVGSIITGKVRKVEEFGAFIDIDNTQPRLSGLAHRSRMAENPVDDARKFYNADDVVKAKVLTVNAQTRKISLGLKMAYFEEEDESEAGGVDVGIDEDDGIDLSADQTMEDTVDSADEMDVDEHTEAGPGLSTGGFDWTGDALDTANGADYESEAELAPKKKRKSEIKVDMTGDLDKNGPRSTSDFERQLLGQPNDSALWIQYMAFHLELSEIQKARDIAERALRTIHIRETDEKANIWIALLNLEVEYGKESTLEDVFKRACEYQDKLTMHEKLASIYIDSGKHQQADDVFERIIKNKGFRASPDVWLNYATFLLSQLQEPDRARVLLPRALKSVPTNEHRSLTAKFAALEFRTESGDAERGRTIFEGLVTEFPKWTNGWDMWVDIEQARIADGSDKEAVERVTSLYERMSQTGMKKKRAKHVFKRWLEFEQSHGSESSQEKVKAIAKEYVEKLKGQDDE